MRARSLLPPALAGLLAISCAPSGTSYTVRILNRDTLALDSIVVEGPGVRSAFGSVPPGQDAERSFVVRHDVVLRVNALRGQQLVRYNLGGYRAEGPGGIAEVLVTMGGELRVGTPVPAVSSPARP